MRASPRGGGPQRGEQALRSLRDPCGPGAASTAEPTSSAIGAERAPRRAALAGPMPPARKALGEVGAAVDQRPVERRAGAAAPPTCRTGCGRRRRGAGGRADAARRPDFAPSGSALRSVGDIVGVLLAVELDRVEAERAARSRRPRRAAHCGRRRPVLSRAARAAGERPRPASTVDRARAFRARRSGRRGSRRRARPASTSSALVRPHT